MESVKIYRWIEQYAFSVKRRVVRVVEGAALEMLCTKVPRVRIPNSPPNVHGNFDRIIVGFFHAQKPLEIRLSACFGV